MNPNDTQKRELLLRFLEAQELGFRDLSPEERDTAEALLQENEWARREAEEIVNHLRLLGSLRPPVIPSNLGGRCLEALHGRRVKRIGAFRWRWVWVGSLAVLTVFLVGIWTGQRMTPPDEAPFVQLVRAQQYFIGRLETNLAHYYQQPSLTAENPWYQPIENLKTTSLAFAAAYEKNAGDPVIARGLSLALAQNINLLKSLCDYIENNNAIPDRDIQWLDTSLASDGGTI